jgi:hypothetical protein
MKIGSHLHTGCFTPRKEQTVPNSQEVGWDPEHVWMLRRKFTNPAQSLITVHTYWAVLVPRYDFSWPCKFFILTAPVLCCMSLLTPRMCVQSCIYESILSHEQSMFNYSQFATLIKANLRAPKEIRRHSIWLNKPYFSLWLEQRPHFHTVTVSLVLIMTESKNLSSVHVAIWHAAIMLHPQK